MRVFEPTSIIVETTHRCTAECSHCNMNSSPSREGTLSWAQLESILTQVVEELDSVRLVVFAGGEPTLLGEDLHRAIGLCKRNGLMTRVITNAFWAKSMDAARAMTRVLREAGLDELNISTDDYHLPWISIQRVQWAFSAAQEAGFLSVALANCAGPESWLSAERVEALFGVEGMVRRYDEGGDTIEHHWSTSGRGTETFVMLSNANLQKIGRAEAHLSDADLPSDFDFEELAAQGGCPWALRSAAISPKGHLLSCCGFDLEDNPILDYGDLSTHRLVELLDAADQDVITNMIAIFGPPRIMQILEQIAPDEVCFERSSYTSYCEVCSDLVNIPQNREALYKHQGAFIEGVLDVRAHLTERYSQGGGRVRLPQDLVIVPGRDTNHPR